MDETFLPPSIHTTMLKVDILQVFISTTAIFGIGVIWIDFDEKVFKTVCHLISAPFTSAETDLNN